LTQNKKLGDFSASRINAAFLAMVVVMPVPEVVVV
jgi:hypothetical protein